MLKLMKIIICKKFSKIKKYTIIKIIRFNNQSVSYFIYLICIKDGIKIYANSDSIVEFRKELRN
jgi:hypothetical protein